VNPPNLKALRVDSNIAPRFAARDTGFSAELKWKPWRYDPDVTHWFTQLQGFGLQR